MARGDGRFARGTCVPYHHGRCSDGWTQSAESRRAIGRSATTPSIGAATRSAWQVDPDHGRVSNQGPEAGSDGAVSGVSGFIYARFLRYVTFRLLSGDIVTPVNSRAAIACRSSGGYR